MGEGAKGLEGEMQGTMEHFASFGLGFLRNLLIHWHMPAFISGPAASPQDRLAEERRGPTDADSAVDLILPLWPDYSSTHQTDYLRLNEIGHHTTLTLVNIKVSHNTSSH